MLSYGIWVQIHKLCMWMIHIKIYEFLIMKLSLYKPSFGKSMSHLRNFHPVITNIGTSY